VEVHEKRLLGIAISMGAPAVGIHVSIGTAWGAYLQMVFSVLLLVSVLRACRIGYAYMKTGEGE
jgi:hypothetical protein